MIDIFNMKLPEKYGKFISKYFETISFYYHIFFIGFLGYLIHFRKPDIIIPHLFIRLLGSYVIFYGTIICP